MTTTTEINEKPILFSTPLVQAILEGRKTQTRRVIKPQPDIVAKKNLPNWNGQMYAKKLLNPDREVIGATFCTDPDWSHGSYMGNMKSPYGKPGDELWVRETFGVEKRKEKRIVYKAGPIVRPVERWKPSIHMPREASRIQLTVTDIRVERVQEITADDIKKEGVRLPESELYPETNANDKLRSEWISLWDSINADRGYSWESNPWVWVVDFEIKTVKGA